MILNHEGPRAAEAQWKVIIRLLKFEPFIRAADTYWPSVLSRRNAVKTEARTQVTRALRNVDNIFSINASLVAASQQIGVSVRQ